MMRVLLQPFNERRDAQKKRWAPFVDLQLPGHGENVVSTPCGLDPQWWLCCSFVLPLTWTRRSASFSPDHGGVTSAIQWSSSVTHPGEVFMHHHKACCSPSLWQVSERKSSTFSTLQNTTKILYLTDLLTSLISSPEYYNIPTVFYLCLCLCRRRPLNIFMCNMYNI